jgi:hypothetical protein
MPAPSAAAISARVLPTPEKHDPLRRHAGGQRPAQLTLGHDIHSRRRVAEGRQTAWFEFALTGEADERVRVREGVGEDPVMALEVAVA